MFNALVSSLNHTLSVLQRSDSEFPDIVVKNTFLDVPQPKLIEEAPKSQSCPIAAFSSSSWSNESIRSRGLDEAVAYGGDLQLSELADAARIFSQGQVPREVMESLGHVHSRIDSTEALASANHDVTAVEALPVQHPEFSSDRSSWQSVSDPSPQRDPVRSPPTWYRVSFRGGVNVRMLPHVESNRTGETLVHNEIFPVSEQLPGPDGRIYLRLADGRGWVFDDSVLLPDDPSVVRGNWTHVAASSPANQDLGLDMPVSTANSQWEPMEEPAAVCHSPSATDATKKRRRRRRGGAARRRSKGKVTDAAEADTRAPSEEEDRNTSEPASDC